MSGWLPREDLDEALLASLGAENVHLHNDLILCLLNNARCRYLPVELMPHVPASCRGEVVRRRAGDVEALPSASPTSPSSNGGASLPFQGKRKDGILPMKFEGGPVAAAGAAAAGVRRGPIGIDDNHGSAGRPNALVKLEAAGGAGGASRKGLAPPPPPPPPGSAAKGVGGLGSGGGGRGGPARHGKELLIAAAPGTTRRSVEASGRSSEQSDEVSDEQLMDEIEAQFGAGSDIWRPWSLDAVEEEGEQQESGRKRPGSWAGSEAGGRERSLKSRKGERGGVMTCASAGAGALVGCAGECRAFLGRSGLEGVAPRQLGCRRCRLWVGVFLRRATPGLEWLLQYVCTTMLPHSITQHVLYLSRCPRAVRFFSCVS